MTGELVKVTVSEEIGLADIGRKTLELDLDHSLVFMRQNQFAYAVGIFMLGTPMFVRYTKDSAKAEQHLEEFAVTYLRGRGPIFIPPYNAMTYPDGQEKLVEILRSVGAEVE